MAGRVQPLLRIRCRRESELAGAVADHSAPVESYVTRVRASALDFGGKQPQIGAMANSEQTPDTEATRLVGNVKVTRNDWLSVARDILISEGVSEVKVQPIGQQLGVSRSSFYWYFGSRKDLLDALLEDWRSRNTSVLLDFCGRPAANISESVCNFFRVFVGKNPFDQMLDFAVRDWSRRDGSVRAVIDVEDRKRLEAIAAMFERHGYAPAEAEVRARILYFMQLGYHALDQKEPMAVRMARLENYIVGFTGKPADVAACDALRAETTLADRD